jgi:hypothetical protein
MSGEISASGSAKLVSNPITNESKIFRG